VATTFLSPSNPAGAGADEVTATVVLGGTTLSDTRGFEINATNVTLAFDALTPAGFTLAEYAQTPLTLRLGNVSVGSPVNVTVTSSCLASGKATISPSTFTATTTSVVLLYKDNGCGALQQQDAIQAVVVGSANAATLTMPLSQPGVSSVAFIQAVPDTIYLKGSGLGESSTVTFEVRDAAGNPLRNQRVQVTLLTGSGGLTMEGRPFNTPVALDTDANGRVSARVNAGTVPTPVRVQANVSTTFGGTSTTVSTVSSNLSVAVGLPSQLNFSLSQSLSNIEGYDRDGTVNTYTIIAADRSGNPVPAGTSINFTAEGGQVEASRQTQLFNGIARTSVNFVSAQPRPADGRVTITAYALGEESFEDLNGNNTFDAGEPFQDLGNVIKDRLFNAAYDASEDEFLSLGISSSAACVPPPNTRLGLDASIPSMPNTCDGVWSGAGKVYVRRAAETVLSTSGARPLWASTGGASGDTGLDAGCAVRTLQVGPASTATASFAVVAGQTWYAGPSASGTLTLIAADANNLRLNPMAAGTTITASTNTTGLTVTLNGGTPVPSTSSASLVSLSYSFGETAPSAGLVTVTFTSPSLTATSVAIPLVRENRPSVCAP
jgi:hypothetical protein